MHRLAICLLTAAIALPSFAAPATKSGDIPNGSLYRYTTEKGRLVITSTLPQEAIYLGYDVIDGQGRIIKTVEKALPESERAKQRELISIKQKDDELRKLYPTADDAIRARDRKISSIQLSIDYSRNTITQLNSKLSAEVAAAANYEKSGRPIPENMQATIDQFSRQIREQEQQIAQYESDIESVNDEFQPFIDRLRELNKN